MATTAKLGLALSGGGFRATLFHLGMIVSCAMQICFAMSN